MYFLSFWLSRSPRKLTCRLTCRSATVLLANPQPSFMVTIQKAGLLDSIHRLIFVSVADAIEFARLSSAEKGNDLEAAGFPEKA